MRPIKIIAITCLLLSWQSTSFAQRNRNQPEDPIFYMGIGLGMDYGGLGVRGEILPIPYLGIFAGVGYNFNGLGANGGLSFKALPFKKLSPVIQAMYGYNAVIVVEGAAKYNKTYYGPTVGAGLDWKVGRRANKLFFSINYPIRSQEFYDDLDAIKADPFVKMENEPLPVAVTIGFNFGI